ncbi:Na(+)-translocating NADH-quinone reductase subunit A [bacterium]|nr:Na(+)-translocating NADH-quinone reductase subunit A [bacterium]
MNRIRIKRGLDLPLAGSPDSDRMDSMSPTRVAVLGSDYPGLKPRMAVKPGDTVQIGDLLFTDNTTPGVRYCSPVCGTVKAVNRGQRRVLLSVVIDVEHNSAGQLSSLDPVTTDIPLIIKQLCMTGLWTALRTRPFGRVANPDIRPAAIFVTAMDTEPFAPSMAPLVIGREESFVAGISVLKRLTEGSVHICFGPDYKPPLIDDVNFVEFTGPHPSGLPGTHIHFLSPVHRNRHVWHIGLQDVIAFGLLFSQGVLDFSRIISLAGPEIKAPKLVKTTIGASLDELISGRCIPGMRRIISGSVLNGHTADGPTAFLGRYHQIVSVMAQDNVRRLFGWLSLGWPLFSIRNMVASRLIPGKKLALTTAQNGGHRTIVPIGNYEKMMPLDILATPLLKALASTDLDEAEALGALELIEEDLALATLVCPGKIDHGVNLRTVLTHIEKEC